MPPISISEKSPPTKDDDCVQFQVMSMSLTLNLMRRSQQIQHHQGLRRTNIQMAKYTGSRRLLTHTPKQRTPLWKCLTLLQTGLPIMERRIFFVVVFGHQNGSIKEEEHCFFIICRTVKKVGITVNLSLQRESIVVVDKWLRVRVTLPLT